MLGHDLHVRMNNMKTKQATDEQVDKTRLSTVLIEVIISGKC